MKNIGRLIGTFGIIMLIVFDWKIFIAVLLLVWGHNLEGHPEE